MRLFIFQVNRLFFAGGFLVAAALHGLLEGQTIAAAEGTRASRSPLVGVVCVEDQSTIYFPRSLYEARLAAGNLPLASLAAVKDGAEQYTYPLDRSSFSACLGRGGDIEMVPVELEDSTLFMFPGSVFSGLGMHPPVAVTALRSERAKMRRCLVFIESMRAFFEQGGSVLEKELVARVSADETLKCLLQVTLARVPHLPGWLTTLLATPEEHLEEDKEKVNDGDSDGRSTPSSGFSIGMCARVRNVTSLLVGSSKQSFREAFFRDGRTLDLSELRVNAIDDLPLVLQECFSAEERAAIRELNLSFNDIRLLPAAAFSSLPNLEQLVLSGNRFTSISPNALEGLSRLEALFLNHMTNLVLPDDFFRHVPHLRHLWLHASGLTTLPCLGALRALESLDVSLNRLTALPDCSLLASLRVCNLIGNAIRLLVPAHFPLGPDGCLAIEQLFLNNNALEEVPSAFFALLPDRPFVVSLHNNPFWGQQRSQGVVTDAGYEALGLGATAGGEVAARAVSAAIFNDIRTKLCRHLGQANPLIRTVVAGEIAAGRALANIDTTLADRGQWLRDNAWWIMLVAGVITAGIGGGMGFLVRPAVAGVMARVLAGAGIGAVIGAGLAYLGCRLVVDGSNVYLNTGGSRVHMTTGLKSMYVGVYRAVALFALLKQYLATFCTSLQWLLHYDEYALDATHVHRIVSYLEERLRLEEQVFFARIDDPTTIALLHELLAVDPMVAINKHAPADLFGAQNIGAAALDVGADFCGIGFDKIVALRAVIIRSAAAARSLRALLTNRYIGARNHSAVCQFVCGIKELKKCLGGAIEEVLNPLMLALEEHGEDGGGWHAELAQCRTVAAEALVLLRTFYKQKKHLFRLVGMA